MILDPYLFNWMYIKRLPRNQPRSPLKWPHYFYLIHNLSEKLSILIAGHRIAALTASIFAQQQSWPAPTCTRALISLSNVGIATVGTNNNESVVCLCFGVGRFVQLLSERYVSEAAYRSLAIILYDMNFLKPSNLFRHRKVVIFSDF